MDLVNIMYRYINKFINDCARRSLKLGIITEDDIKKLRIKL